MSTDANFEPTDDVTRKLLLNMLRDLGLRDDWEKSGAFNRSIVQTYESELAVRERVAVEKFAAGLKEQAAVVHEVSQYNGFNMPVSRAFIKAVSTAEIDAHFAKYREEHK